jgi:hypothetical protein
MQFYQLAVGARFVFRGRKYRKIAMCMTEDEDRVGHIFQGETEVEADGVLLLLPADEAERWKPSEEYWADHIKPAPGQAR